MRDERYFKPDVSRQTEVTPALNEVQRKLRAGLEWFGPSGERWRQGPLACDITFKTGCIWYGLFATKNNGSSSYLHKAVYERGYSGYIAMNSDPKTTWPDVVSVYNRAIELAA